MNNTYKDCYIRFDGNQITAGNSMIERIWAAEGSIPYTVSVKNKANRKEWADTFRKPGFFCHPRIDFSNRQSISLDRVYTCDDFTFGSEALYGEIVLEYKDVKVLWRVIIYPGKPVMRNSITLFSKYEKLTSLEKSNENYLPYEVNPDIFRKNRDIDYMDHICLRPRHIKWKCMQLADQTDDNDNLLSERKGICTLRDMNLLKGNILTAEDTLEKSSIIFIKEGPTSEGYIGGTEQDYVIAGRSIFTAGNGWTLGEITPDGISSYSTAMILCDSGTEPETYALKQYYECVHKYNEERDALVMCNTWGDMSCDGKICEDFILKELEIAEKMGVNYYQIDDGWQKGRSGASVFPGGIQDKSFYKQDPDFWTVDTNKFPNGLDKVTRKAADAGIKLGLWFSPDETDNYSLWRTDAEVIINLHERYGISAFKIDGVRFSCKTAEENLYKMMSYVVKKTHGKVFFNMDVTADCRSGYMGRVQYGNIFLENRFTDGFPKMPNYYPYRTLRNIWNISRCYPAYRIQAEVLNADRNKDLYSGDVFSPEKCGQEYILALTLFASPLMWMELTGLSEQQQKTLSKLITVYRHHQAAIQQGTVFPIGCEPDGTAWTGFQSVTDSRGGYILIIREYSKLSSEEIKLFALNGKALKTETILGQPVPPVIYTSDKGYAEFSLGKQHSYSLFRYTV